VLNRKNLLAMTCVSARVCNLGVPEVDLPSDPLALPGHRSRPFGCGLVEVQYASLEVFAENLGKRAFDLLSAPAWATAARCPTAPRTL
jgi:hypothetical protein